jgi:hypothetical protein
MLMGCVSVQISIQQINPANISLKAEMNIVDTIHTHISNGDCFADNKQLIYLFLSRPDTIWFMGMDNFGRDAKTILLSKGFYEISNGYIRSAERQWGLNVDTIRMGVIQTP